MFTGFSKIVEERIRKAIQKGEFSDLAGAGQPLKLEEDRHIVEELRLAHKILKNAECLPPEIELKKEIHRTEELLTDMKDTAVKYQTLKKLNFLIMKLNTMRNTSVDLEKHQYSTRLIEKIESRNRSQNKVKIHEKD